MSNDLTKLREHLFDTLAGLKAGTVDLDHAQAINDVAQTLVATAKVEVDYLRASGGGESTFLDTAICANNLPAGVTVHRLRG